MMLWIGRSVRVGSRARTAKRSFWARIGEVLRAGQVGGSDAAARGRHLGGRI